MTNQQANTRKQEIDRWIEFAERDVHVAQITLKENVYHDTCFHAQQAIEKVLKAFILWKTGKVPRQHLISRLAKLTQEASLTKRFHKELAFLDQFYIPTRYPDAFPGSLPEGLPTKEDGQKALDYAQQIVDFIKEKLNAA